MVEIISILKCIKTILNLCWRLLVFKMCKNFFNLQEKYKKKNDRNDMATDVAQREHINIKCYVSTFSNIQICIATSNDFLNGLYFFV